MTEKTWAEMNIFRILQRFYQENHKCPAAEIRLGCLAHWVGLVSAKFFISLSDLKKSRHFRQSGNLLLPFLAGWLTGNSRKNDARSLPGTSDIRSELTGILKTATVDTSLFWALTLPGIWKKHAEKELRRRFAKLPKQEEASELRMKKNVCMAMLQQLLNKKPPGRFSLWKNMLSDFARSPESVRRTAQAMIPIYYYLSDSFKLAENAVEKTLHLVNCSNFTICYLKHFDWQGIQTDHHAPLSNLLTSLERQLFTSLKIGFASMYDPDALQSITFYQTDDLLNTFFATQMANKFNDCQC